MYEKIIVETEFSLQFLVEFLSINLSQSKTKVHTGCYDFFGDYPIEPFVHNVHVGNFLFQYYLLLVVLFYVIKLSEFVRQLNKMI